MSGVTYLIVVIGIFIAKILGFGRNIIFASAFGASELTDIYFQIFGIPTFIFTGIGTALSTIVIKNLNKNNTTQGKNNKEYLSKFISKISVITILITIVLYLITGLIVKLILPGLDPAFFDDACKMMYIMLPSALFIIIAYIMSGVLQNAKVFFLTSIMSLPYNVLIITALLFKNIDIFTICWITTIGWFLHIIILMPSFYKRGFRLFSRTNKLIKFSRKEKNLEVIYIFVSNLMLQMCFIYDKASVSHEAGAATTINYATNFFIIISSIFVVAMSNVSFPHICKNYELKRTKEVKNTMQQLISLLITIVVPFILIVVIFGKDIIALFYESDKFTKTLTDQTAILFIIYTFSIFGYVCQELFCKILYLDNRYKIPFIGSIIIMIIKPIINVFLIDYGITAIALSTTILSNLYGLFIFMRTTKVIGNYFNKKIMVDIFKILLSSSLSLLTYFVIDFVGIKILPQKISFLLPLCVCGLIYIFFIWISGHIRSLFSKNTYEEEA